MPDELDSVLQRAVAALRLPVGNFDGLDDRIMSAVRAEATTPRAGRWMTARYTVRLSPLGALAAAAGIAGVLLGGIWAGRSSVVSPLPERSFATSIAAPATRADNAAVRSVRFEVAAPGALPQVSPGRAGTAGSTGGNCANCGLQAFFGSYSE